MNQPDTPAFRAENAHAPERFLAQLEVLFSAAQIEQRVRELAAELSEVYRSQNLVMVPILRGSIMFAADLLRYMTLYPEVEFINASSYGNALVSSGEVRLFWPPDLDLRGKDVLIVEDIVDSGTTLRHLADRVAAWDPATLRYISLLYKDRGGEGWPVDWFGFSIPDVFVVGYGLDYRQRFRNLPYIAKVNAKA